MTTEKHSITTPYLHASRYAVDDEVWGLTTRPHRYWRVCPICRGTRKVAVEGHPDLMAHCPSRDCRDGKIWLEDMGSVYDIRKLTIGQIRVQVGYEPNVTYMCRETGVGSGAIWSEERLFPSEEEAEHHARETLGARRKVEMELVTGNVV